MLLNAAGDCFFYFLPLILGFNLAKKFGIDPFFGTILAGAMCYPTIQNTDINIMGYVTNTSYVSTFLPILFGLILAAPIYKWFNKVLPSVVKGFMTPLLTLVIIFPITFILIGPLANLIGTGLNTVLTAVCSFSPLLAGIILGGLWQVFVLFGIHGVLTVIAFMDLVAGNPSQVLAFSYGASFATCGAVLAVLIKTKDQKLKSIALPAFISSIFGVTEPATYGVTLPRKKIFAVCCIGGVTSGIVVALSGLLMHTYAGMGVIGLLGFIDPVKPNIIAIILMAIVPFVASGIVVALSGLLMHTYAGMGVIGLLGFIDPVKPNIIAIILMAIVPFVVSLSLGLVIYKDSDYEYLNEDEKKDEKKVEKREVTGQLNQETILMPVDGIIQSLTSSRDDAFASEALGKGCLLIPANGKVYSPCDGVVRTLFPTKHAIGIVTDNGCEILIHIGVNTVALEGKYFETHIAQGDKVEAGQLLVEFDKEKIEAEGYSCEIPVIITNTTDYLDVVELDHGQHNHGDKMLKVVR